MRVFSRVGIPHRLIFSTASYGIDPIATARFPGKEPVRGRLRGVSLSPVGACLAPNDPLSIHKPNYSTKGVVPC